jgi:dolichyl-phosphate beta-glucosyltransferase
LHQSLSFEVVVQTVQWLSPALSCRAFETEFLIRETGMPRTEVTEWLRSRRLALPFIALSAAAAVCWFLDSSVPALVFAMLAVLAAANSVRHFVAPAAGRHPQRAHLTATVAGLAVWSAEGGLFVFAAQGLLEPAQSLMLYLGFTAAVEAALVPLALGVAELPALLAVSWSAGSTALAILLIFHASRLILLMILAAIYLPRYKLTVDDLLDQELISRLARSQRPPEGWRFEDLGDVHLDLSVVIPAFNEEERLPPYLDAVVDELRGAFDKWEILVVDDGSSDRTRAIVRRVSRSEARVRLVCNETNLGKGGAVARGVVASRGRHVLFADADGATPASEIGKLLVALHAGAEVAIGSRRGRDMTVSQDRNPIRATLGASFYSLVNFLAVPGIRDTQCGFKAFRRDAALRLFDGLNETGWAFDVELLYRAQLVGYAIAEVPVTWTEMDGSKLDPVRDAIRMAGAIFKIRRRNAGFLRRVATHRAIPDDTQKAVGLMEQVR